MDRAYSQAIEQGRKVAYSKLAKGIVVYFVIMFVVALLSLKVLRDPVASFIGKLIAFITTRVDLTTALFIADHHAWFEYGIGLGAIALLALPVHIVMNYVSYFATFMRTDYESVFSGLPPDLVEGELRVRREKDKFGLVALPAKNIIVFQVDYGLAVFVTFVAVLAVSKLAS